MNTMKKLKITTFALAALAAPLAASAAADGDIVDIRAVDTASMTFGGRGIPLTQCSADHPLVAGDKLYIRVRMLVRNASLVPPPASQAPQTWSFQDGALGAYYPYTPKLGIFIGDRPAFAEFSDFGPELWQKSGELTTDDAGNSSSLYRYYTDFYFAYDVQPGDIGLPVSLMNSNGEKASEATSNLGYYLLNCDTAGLDHYVLKDTSGNVANFWYGDDPSVDWPPPGERLLNLTLEKEGVFVKTVDFDDDYVDDGSGIWRDVYQGMSEPPGVQPAIELPSELTATADATVWIWSEDESIVVPYGNTQTITYTDEYDVLQTRQALPVTVKAGESMATFKLKGGDAAAIGAVTNICMSPTRTPTYSKAGSEVRSIIRRKVRIAQAPEPTVGIYLDGSDPTKTVTATPDYVTCNTRLAIKVTPACPSPVTVSLSAAVSGDDTLSSIDALFDANILRIADGAYASDPINQKLTSVTIPADTPVVYLNLYVLGGTAKTGTKGVTFSLSKTSGPDNVTVNGACTLKINRSTPTIASSDPAFSTEDSPSTVTVISGGSIDFALELEDSYRDLYDTATGYTFKWACDGEDIDDETDIVMDGDGRFVGSAQFWNITDGKELTLCVVNPDGRTSAKVKYNLVVTDSKKTTMSFAESGRIVFCEGETAWVNLGLTQPYKGTGYIFVDADNAATLANVTTTLKTDGAQIDQGKTAVATPRAITFEDGLKDMTLKAVLCSANDKTKKVTTYVAGTLSFTVTNRPPAVKSLNCAGTYMTPEMKGTTISVPRGVNKPFSIVADDVLPDLNATGDDAFQVEWTIDGETYYTSGNPSTTNVLHMFKNVKAAAPVYVKMKDKDMSWPSDPDFFFYVNVREKPGVSISTSASGGSKTGGIISENSVGQTITLSLSDEAADDITVRLKVKQAADGGYVRLKEIEGQVVAATNSVGQVIPGEYDVTFTSGALTRTLRISDMDGTDGTLDGLEVNASVTTETKNADGVRWCDFYTPADTYLLIVRNAVPTIRRPSDIEVVNTNENASAETPYLISYAASDVPADLTNGVLPGLKVDISVNGTSVMTTNVVDSETRTHAITFEGAGTHTVTVTFTDKDGMSNDRTMYFYVQPNKTLDLRAHGPATAVASDTGDSQRYSVAAGLGAGRVWAGSHDIGPQRVANFVHTYSVGRAQTSIEAFAFAYKADGSYDDGSLKPGPDKGIDSTGSWVKGQTIPAGDNYNYTQQHMWGKLGYDSFLYAWSCNNIETSASSSSSSTTSSKQFLFNIGDYGEMAIPLPADESKKGDVAILSYPKQYWEAIFSREYLVTDNCGDINGDAIPDVCMYRYGLGVVDTTTHEIIVSGGEEAGEGDLTDVSNYNDDTVKTAASSGSEGGSSIGSSSGDFLPVIETAAFGALIPNLPSGWDENPFTAKLEIRGYGTGLNDAMVGLGFSEIESDRVYAEEVGGTWQWTPGCSINELEFEAWRDYAASHGLSWTNSADWTAWSPERPTNPTIDDTDGDKMPDGYEYFFWYRAHVGYNDNGVRRYLTGRKFDPRNPGEGKFISSAAIALAMDPRSDLAPVDFPSAGETIDTSASSVKTRDVDNDGLADMLEFVIGTNPFDFDTDGDGLPDGFEILVAGTDPLLAYTTTGICDAMRNYDGDAMAITSPYFERTAVSPRPKHVTSLVKFALVDPDGYTDGVQWYVTSFVPDGLTYKTNSVGGYVVKVGTNTYVTVAKPDVVDVGGVVRLAADLPQTDTWLTGTFADTDGDKLVRLMPTRLVAGTVLAEKPDTSTTTDFGYIVFSSDVSEAFSAWPYGRSISTETTGDVAANRGGFGFLALGRYKTAKAGYKLAWLPEADDKIAYLHHQVYQEFGFDPRTAWNANTPLGARWGSDLGGLEEFGIESGEGKANYVSAIFGYAAVATRTREFTLYDEFLVMSFFLNGLERGLMFEQPTTVRPWYTLWSMYTTNGRGPNEPDLDTGDEHYVGREIAENSSDDNGADTDGDGVPDGWELYIMTGPKKQTTLNGVKAFRIAFPAPYDDGYFSSYGPFVPDARNASMTDNPVELIMPKTGYAAIGGDDDDLTEYREFAGTDTTIYYSSYSTTITRPEEDARWLNKFFPTDPWNADTDADGLGDRFEKSGIGPRGGGWGFIYGNPADNGKLVSIPGGGLNPLSVDTDYDGLPDAWEYQYNGETIYSDFDATYAASDNGQGNPLEGLVDGMDGTVRDAYTIVNGRLDPEGGIGPVNLIRGADGSKMFGKINRDYDNDGLENWQEYMVGTMRCWRYDDILSAWDAIPDEAYWDSNGEFTPDYDLINAKYGSPAKPVIDTSAADGGRGEFWYKTLVDRSSPIYNPRLLTDLAPGDHCLTRITNGWDPAFLDDEEGGAYYYIYNTLDGISLSTLWAKPFVQLAGKKDAKVPSAGPDRYISCSPIDYDSDHDGMDDYYELFHGLNPLLGGTGTDMSATSETAPCDLVSEAWGGAKGPFQAWGGGDPKANYWTYQVASGNYYKTGAKPRGNGYDFEYFPWLNGLATADPDGDDLRNQSEAIMPKLASSVWHHTDPSPLWMTDSSYPRSLTRLFFRMPGRGRYAPTLGDTFKYNGRTYYFDDYGGWAPVDDSKNLPARFVAYSSEVMWGVFGADERNWMFSFEENEGYDSDHDAMSDCTEAAGKLRTASDPQDANSPNRRQAMYFQGPDRPSALQTPPEIVEMYPVVEESWPEEMSFLQFTVEAWANAESSADATVVERAVWCDPSKAGDEDLVRKNFQLGIKSGRWYARYDGAGTLADTGVEVFSRAAVETGKWHHLAATFDGSRFILYVDGREAATPVNTSLRPEYGSSAMVFHRSSTSGPYPFTPGDHWYEMDYTLRPIVVGASLRTQREGGSVEAFDVHNGAGWSKYTRFFKGFVDEVRIWDGARSAADILADVNTRYSRAMAIENRTSFYEGWVKYGSRYGRDYNGDPVSVIPELRYHFSFDSVPGGYDEKVVAKTPAGFDYYQAAIPVIGVSERGAAYLSRPLDWDVSWWKKVVVGDGTAAAPGYGSVYGSADWVQWVPNTVAHLPRFDGTTLDSFFWSENTCGDTEGSYYFARAAEPVSRWTQFAYNGWIDYSDSVADAYYRTSGFRHHLTCDLDGLVIKSASGDESETTYTNNLRRTASRFTMFRFTGRTALQDGADLLPLGGAYAKTCPEMWDSQGVSTAWEVTSDDDDNDGLPDAWENYAIGNYSPASAPVDWDTLVTWNGRQMTAGDAYRHDLAGGRILFTDSSGFPQVSTTPVAALRQRADEDASHTPDWWDDFYGVYGEGGTTDTDNDGLNNYVEYLVSEIFPFGITLDPKMPMSDTKTLDYFRKVGELYIGEMFTDHDQMEDHWERSKGSDSIDANVWDAQRDGDEDGWSNFAESRYNGWSRSTLAQLISHTVGDTSTLDMPQPAIKLTARYNGIRNLMASSSGARDAAPALRVVTYTDPEMTKADAEFVVRPGEEVSGEFYMGGWEDRVIRGTLQPGHISYGDVDIVYSQLPQDDMYSWVDSSGDHHISRPYSEFREALKKDPAIIQNVTSFEWSHLLPASAYGATAEKAVTVTSGGNIAVYGERVGKIDLQTGDFEFDMAAMANLSVIGFYKGSVENAWGIKEAVFKLTYKAKVPDTELYKVTASLVTPSTGFVKGGKTSIMAYWDVGNDGSYTPGTDPFGVVRDVDVGWCERDVEIELSEASAITPRIKLWSISSSDRSASFGAAEYSTGLAQTVPSNDVTRVSVVRYKYDNTSVAQGNYRVVADKTFSRRVRDYLHEGDVVGDAFDIDWDTLETNLWTKSGFPTCTNVLYAVVIGDAEISSTVPYLSASLPAHPLLISRRFEKTHTPPTAFRENGDDVCSVAQPTFRWKIENEDRWASAFGTTYTAFKVKVWDIAGNEVYDSGYQRMPAADSRGVYSWTAPLYVDCPSPSGGHRVFNNLSNYTWQVFTYNSKFKTDDVGTVPQQLRMNVAVSGMGSYNTGIEVRYAGPATTSLTKGLIHVQAFKTPDFAGYPVAEAVTNASGMVTLSGLRAGTYFLRAYIDTDYDWTLDDWESWGYLSERDIASVTGSKAIFTPVSVAVGPEINGDTPRTIYVEDRDTDGDGFPDAWEAEQNGYVFDSQVVGPVTGDAEFFAANTNLAAVLNSSDTMESQKRDQLMQLFFLSGKYGVSLLTGVSASALRSSSSGALRVASSVVDDTVAITSLEIDRATGEVVLGVGAETEADETIDPVVAALYSISCDAEVTVKVYRTETLASEWVLAATIEKVALSSAGTEIRVKLPEGLDMSSGFFKVEIE